MLRKIRDWYKVFFCIDLVCGLTHLCAVVLVGVAAAAVFAVRGEFGGIFPALAGVLGSLALFGFSAWVYYDAPKALEKIREQCQEQRQDASNKEELAE